MFGGYVGTGVARPGPENLPILPPNIGFEGIITIIQLVTNMFK
jgi:hypothetical protein